MISALLLSLAPVPLAPQSVSPCDRAIETIANSNVFALAEGAAACEEEGRDDDLALINFVIGIRMVADISLLPPADIVDLMSSPALGTALARDSDFVDAELARDAPRFEKLMQRVQQIDLSVAPGYDPGWETGHGAKRELYGEVIAGLRADQIAMERYIAERVRDDVYFAAYAERTAILADTSGNGQPLPERFNELSKVMQARIDILGEPPSGSSVPWRKVYEPASDAPFTVLYTGFDGPEENEAMLFRSAEEVSNAWITQAITPEKLSAVIAQVDFENEVLGLYAIGRLENGTANVFVTDFAPEDDRDGHLIAVRAGISGGDCGFETAISYPFVLVKTASRNAGAITARSRANYPDQCAPPVAATPFVVGTD